jgi:type II secretory pathway component PulK
VTRLQRVLCIALGLLATAAVVTATTVHDRADAGRRALAEANRAHARWAAERAREVAARERVRDITARRAALRRETANSTRRLLAAIEQARTARRRVVVAPPRVVYRVRTALVADRAG